MKSGKRVALYSLYIVIGAVLFGLGIAEILDEFWSGMGGALIAVGALRLIQQYRLRKDETYREKMETEVTDERNRFIRNKAWAWAGYLFILIAAVSSIVLKVLGQDLLSMVASYAVCILIVLYWVCYLVLKKKY